MDRLPVGLRGTLDRRDVQASRGPQSVTDAPALTAHIPAAMRGSTNVSSQRPTTQMKRSVLISRREKAYWRFGERPWRSGPPGLRRCPRSGAYVQAA